MKIHWLILFATMTATLGAQSPHHAPAAPANATTTTMPSAPSRSHLTLTRTHTIAVPLPFAQAFTMFEPVGEKMWAEGWEPVFANADSAKLSDNTVFTRTTASHGQPAQTSIWMITHYDQPNGAIEYRTVVPGVRASRITIKCRVVDKSNTAVDVTYRHTSLSDEGDAFVRTMTEEHYRASIEEWATAIRAYLTRGTPATP